MAAVDTTSLIATLAASYRRQLEMYRTLTALVQKTLSQVVLSRGDVSGVMDSFSRKQELIDAIVNERENIGDCVVLWQERKAGLKQSPQSQELDELLKATQLVIKEFLEYEEQLKKYLEHVTKKGSPVS
jgi:multidrug resistance efflux pump